MTLQWLSHIPTVTVEFHLQPQEYLEVSRRSDRRFLDLRFCSCR